MAQRLASNVHYGVEGDECAREAGKKLARVGLDRKMKPGRVGKERVEESWEGKVNDA